MGQLWDIIQNHIDEQLYPPSYRQLARRLGVQPQTVINWKNPQALPSRENITAIAELTGVPAAEVLRAALVDAGYPVPDPSETPAKRKSAG